MRKLTSCTFLTLDGVMQAPGAPEEDREGGFDQGGWLVPFAAADMGPIMVDWFAEAGGFVLGRKTYQIFAAHWPGVGDADPLAKALNGLPKFVASRTLDQLTWQHSSLLEGDVVEAVRRLKQQPGKDLQIHGSGQLAQALLRHGLIDTCRLWLHPVVLGQGKRLFGDGLPNAFRLVDSTTTSTGVLVATYQQAGPLTFGSFA